MEANKMPILLLVGCLVLLMGSLAADAGCPFDDGSCHDYCAQQGCQLGYCGHFAWIQCICRKCGDEWNWYDKVRYRPDQEVNQTELESLNLNNSMPLILTNSEEQQQQQLKRSQRPQQHQQQHHQQAATLTTLLIPDLSDSNRLELNDIPDENSEKFLDYLAKNHEKLVQATRPIGEHQQQQQQQSSAQTHNRHQSNSDSELEPADTPTSDASELGVASDQSDESATTEEETVEIQISSLSNDTKQQPEQQQQQQQPRESQLARMIRLPVASKSGDDLEA